MMQLPVIVIDTETTGLHTTTGTAVVEVAAVVLMPDGSQTFAFSTLINPFHRGRSPVLETEAMGMHGIPLQDLHRAPPAHMVDQGLDLFYRHVLDDYSPELPLRGLRWTSWRQTFEAVMLGRCLPLMASWPRAACIHHIARGHCRLDDLATERTPSLRQTAIALGIDIPAPRHRALPDAHLAARVLHALLSHDPAQPLELPQ